MIFEKVLEKIIKLNDKNQKKVISFNKI